MGSEVRRILGFEAARARGNPVIVLAAVAVLLYFTLLGIYMARFATEIAALAKQIVEEVRENVGIGLMDIIREATDPAVRALYESQSALLSTLFYFAMLGTPGLVMLLASDQTGSEIGRRHIRFLLPRVRRGSLYIGRAISACVAWFVCAAVALVVVGGLLSLLDKNSNAGTDAVLIGRMIVAVSIYGVPYVAMMAFLNTFISNPFLAYLTSCGFYLIIWLFSAVGSWVNPDYEALAYAIPSFVKYPLMADEAARFLGGAAGAFGYALVFFVLGAWIFRSRDL